MHVSTVSDDLRTIFRIRVSSILVLLFNNVACKVVYLEFQRMGDSSETESRKSFKLLGILDVQNVPCARDSVLYGSAGSIGTGLLHFLATSRVRRSFDVGMGMFIVTTLGSWVYCRYNNAGLRIQQRVIREGIKNKVMYEGTIMDPTNKQDSSNHDNKS